jgi:hypothetical protein
MTVTALGTDTLVLACAKVAVNVPVAVPFLAFGTVIEIDAPVAFEPDTDTLSV